MDGRITGAQIVERADIERKRERENPFPPPAEPLPAMQQIAIQRAFTLGHIREIAGDALAGHHPGGMEAALQRIVQAADAALRR